MVISKKLSLQTRGNGDTLDITDAVARTVRESGLQSGTVTLFCPSSTSGLTTIEFEPGAAAMQEHILRAMRAFTAPVEPHDDVTVMVVVKR